MAQVLVRQLNDKVVDRLVVQSHIDASPLSASRTSGSCRVYFAQFRMRFMRNALSGEFMMILHDNEG